MSNNRPVTPARESQGGISANPSNLDQGQNSGIQIASSSWRSRTIDPNGEEVGSIIDRISSNLVDNQLSTGARDLNRLRDSAYALAASRGRLFEHTPNVLDSFANYTYHIRWSITDDIVSSGITTPDEFQRIQKTVIAESGVTAGFNITELEMDNLCAPQARVQTMMHTGFKMVVKEPYGLSLIDRIYSVSREMGVRNHLTNPTFIEIWFTGYDENGKIVTPTLKESVYKLFRVNITKLESDTKSEGTVYNIEGIFSNMYANADHVAVAPNGVNIGPVTTVGNFFDQLQVALNQQQQQLQYDGRRRIEYVFNLPEEIRNWAFTQSPTASERNGSISVNDPANRTSPTITIARGMDINTILWFVVSMTEEGKRYVAGIGNSRQQGSTSTGRSQANIPDNGMANVIAIHSQSTIYGFDYTTRDYLRRITYTFTEYPTARSMIDQNTVERTQQSTQQENRRQVISSSRRFIKAYEYIFTGRNLDILNLDIKLEWFWQSPIPTHLGENIYQNWSPGRQLDQQGPAMDILNQLNQARDNLNLARAEEQRVIQANPGENDEAKRKRAEATQVRERREQELQNLGTAQRFQETWETRSEGQRTLQNIQVRYGDEGLLNNPEVVERLRLRRNWSDAVRGRSEVYLEDVKVRNIYAPLPISFRPNPGPISQRTTGAGDVSAPDRSSSNDSVDNLPRNRSLVAAVLNDLTTAPYFVEINLGIRGDPYWMGLGNIEEDRRINSRSLDNYNPAAAWFYGGDTGFFLTFRTGESPSEETGYIEFSNSSIAFTGVYIVIEVKSIFKDGKFTQVLKSLRDNLLNSTNAPRQLPAAAGTNSTAVTAAAAGDASTQAASARSTGR